MEGYIQDIIGNMIMFAALYILTRKTPRRSRFWLRFAVCFAVFSLVRYLFFHQLNNYIDPEVWRYVNMGGFSVLMLMMMGAAALCFECDFWSALFCGSAAYCVQHIPNKLYSIFSMMWLRGAGPLPRYALFIALAILSITAFFFLVRRLKPDNIVVDSPRLLTLSVLVIVTAIVMDLLLFRAMREGGDMLRYLVYTYSLLAVCLILSLQLSLVASKKTELELDTIRAMLDAEQDQYLFEKTMIDTVNIKCHDLKHQIAALDESAQKKLRDDIKPVIEAYDSTFRTGNVALDVVLTRENFICREKEIALTCAANGKTLEFMSEVDVYSLFGNILDNAIEATEKLEDKEKRVISLAISREGYFVNIHSENYYSDRLTFSDGLPETTKKDTVYHGYGMKSIKMLVDKYEGSMKVGTNGDRFVLDILFPV